jgi:hypothetical protein
MTTAVSFVRDVTLRQRTRTHGLRVVTFTSAEHWPCLEGYTTGAHVRIYASVPVQHSQRHQYVSRHRLLQD